MLVRDRDVERQIKIERNQGGAISRLDVFRRGSQMRRPCPF
jgi:hypothetical protein